MYTDGDLDELVDREAVYEIDLPQRSFSEVYADVNRAKPGKKARFRNAKYLSKLRECRDFLVALKHGHVSDHHLREVLSTSDFPILFGDVMDTRLLNQYAATTPTWSQYAQRGTVVDFRPSRLIALDGLQSPLYPSSKKVELETVKYDNDLDETAYTTQVEVYEKGIAYNWRMLVNRRGDFLARLPSFLARGAQRTEEKFASDLYMGAGGPDATFFSVGNANLVTGNPALSVAALKTALNTMYAHTDAGGDPIMIDGVVLVVPPLLQLTAQEVLKAYALETTPGSTSATAVFMGVPWISKFKPATNWYQPIVDVSANRHTTWYLFADPNANRPGMEVTFLSGYEQPSLWQKAPNTQRLGGSVDPIMGDFQDMSIHQKIIHIIGGTLIDPKAAVVSNGSGS